MRYSQLLNILYHYALGEVGKVTLDNDVLLMIGRSSDLSYPLQADFHTIYAPLSTTDPELHREEVLALIRRFDLPEERFFPPSS
jgi:hypothetical protein